MSRRSCFRTLLLLLATSSFITFTFLLRCHGGSRPEDDVKAELLIAARGNVGDVGNTIIDINSLDSRPEDISSRRHIAEHRQDAQFQLCNSHNKTSNSHNLNKSSSNSHYCHSRSSSNRRNRCSSFKSSRHRSNADRKPTSSTMSHNYRFTNTRRSTASSTAIIPSRQGWRMGGLSSVLLHP